MLLAAGQEIGRARRALVISTFSTAALGTRSAGGAAGPVFEILPDPTEIFARGAASELATNLEPDDLIVAVTAQLPPVAVSVRIAHPHALADSTRCCPAHRAGDCGAALVVVGASDRIDRAQTDAAGAVRAERSIPFARSKSAIAFSTDATGIGAPEGTIRTWWAARKGSGRRYLDRNVEAVNHADVVEIHLG
jgi:hypothetical protein